MSGINAPDPSECFVLSDGEKKVNYVKDEKLKDTGTFTLLKEDHTMGNMLRYSLLRDPRVLFAGYRMPHPLEYRTLVRVRTTPQTKPTAVTTDALDNLMSETTSLSQQFAAQVAQIAAQKRREHHHHHHQDY